MESILQVPLQDSDKLKLEIPSFDTNQFTPLSTEMERREDASDFDFSLDTWLDCLNADIIGESAECCTVRAELMLFPEVIGAPLRSVRPDKRAMLCALLNER